jgi:AcrR family transcriptional regulator
VDDTRQRIVEATYACVARWGLAKTTVEDAAREANVSRATVYRTFPGGRDELLDAVVAWATLDFFARLYERVQGAANLEELMERGIMFAHRSIVEHEVLQRVMLTEPDKLLPALTVESNRIRVGIAEFLVPFLEQRGVAAGVDLKEAADFLARMVLSYMASPGRWDLDDPVQVAQLVRRELLAGVVGGSDPSAEPDLGAGPAPAVASTGRPTGGPGPTG